MNEYIQNYIKEVNNLYQLDKSKEHAYRHALITMVEGITGCTALNEASPSEFGAPDLTILKNDIVLSFIETKDIDDKDLDGKKSHQEQFERYKNALSTIIFTDYLDFHLYVDGELKDTVRIAEILNGHIVQNPSAEGRFISIIESLRDAKPQKITSASRLAKLMAAKARLLADAIEEGLTKDLDNNSSLWSQYNSFKEVLIPDLTEKKFADIYAQTIAYGLFAARINDSTEDNFSRFEAAKLIPETNPFLRQLFQYIAGYNISSNIQWVVDDLVKIFAATNMKKVMKHFGEETQRTDPVVHFYEDFLSVYDPKTKKQFGVYYTPLPVVDFMVRAVNDVLKNEFDIQDGLADTTKINVSIKRENPKTKKIETTTESRHRVQILDPATGTGTFLAETIRLIKNNIQKGMWPKYVEEHLIPRIHGFELMMAPYTIAHLKLDMLLNWWTDGEKLSVPHKDRLHIYLTNSLEQEALETKYTFAEMIANEANEANEVKHNAPVMVVLGNPPYSGESSNVSKWIMGLMQDYKKEPGTDAKLNEKNPKWINNDYCKFIRMAQEYIKRKNEGILAYICANSFLYSPTFRGMRWNLLKTFDKIYIVNLHGDKEEKKFPAFAEDENVFAIKQGVSINIFIKNGEKGEDELADVYYKDLIGPKETKYDFLSTTLLADIPFVKIKPTPQHYFFTPQNEEAKEEYNKGFAINELLKENNVGVVTANDSVLIANNQQQLLKQVNETYKMVANQSHINPYLFRPLDRQYIYYDESKIARARTKLMCHLKQPNLAIVCKKGFPRDESPMFVSDAISDFRYFSCSGMQGGDYVFPLYLYQDQTEFNFGDQKERVPNLDDTIWQTIENWVQYGQAYRPLTAFEQKGELGFDAQSKEPHFLTPEQIFDYIYGVLHSPAYLNKYKDCLKVDFPRVPYPKNKEDFDHFATLGNQLRELHLMHNVPSMPTIATFYGEGNGIVEGIAFEPNKDDGYSGNVYINNGQCFENVPTSAWNFYIGGYQPAQKWLKDRKGRELSYDDMKHYQKIIAVLLETDRLMKQL